MRPSFAFVLAIVACTVSVALASSRLVRRTTIAPHLEGGVKVNYLDYPYTVSLWLSKNSKVVRQCGGVRLAKKWFLTAAECLNTNKYDHVRLTYPNYNDFQRYSHEELNLTTASFKIHPSYNAVTKANNIALLQVDVWYYENTSSLPHLPSAGKTYANEPAVVSAWLNVTTKDDYKENFDIHIVDTKVVNTPDCMRQHFHAVIVNDGHICGSVSSRNKGLSKNDVGVPLIVIGDGRNLTLVGIGSPIKPPTRIAPMPMLFTKVAPYAEWIHTASGKEIPLPLL